MSGESIDYIFSEEGVLGGLKNYRKRQGQIYMAQAVQTALTESEHLVVEAGTGTGKTFAYLVPVLMSGGRAIVATYSLTLQDQLFTKDIAKLAELLKHPCSVVKIKGIGNYVCLEHLHKIIRTGENALKPKSKPSENKDSEKGPKLQGFDDEVSEVSNNSDLGSSSMPYGNEVVMKGVALTRSDLDHLYTYKKCLEANEDDDMGSLLYDLDGKDMKDKGELSSLKRFLRHKRLLQSTIDSICRRATIRMDFEKCLGAKECGYAKHCAYQQAKEQAKRAKLVILNHSMFCRLADAARTQELKQNERDDQTDAKNAEANKGLFSDFDLCVIDEAHHFPQVIKDTFSRKLGTETLKRVVSQVEQYLLRLVGIYGIVPELLQMVDEVISTAIEYNSLVDDFSEALRKALPGEVNSYIRRLGKAGSSKVESAEQLMNGTLVYGLGQEGYNLAAGFHKLYTVFLEVYKRYGRFDSTQYEGLWAVHSGKKKANEANEVNEVIDAQVLVQEKIFKSEQLNSIIKQLVAKDKLTEAEDKALFFQECCKLHSDLEFLDCAMVEIGTFIEEYFCEPLFGRNFDTVINYRSASWKDTSRGLQFELLISPYSAGNDFRQRILGNKCFADTGFVFTSATIGTGITGSSNETDKDVAKNQLTTFTREMALPQEKTSYLLAESPFEYQSHGMLYVPEFFSKYDDPKFISPAELINGISPVLKRVPGGILVLCTAMSMVKRLYDAIKSDATLRTRTILRQEEGSNRMELVNKFRDDGKAILIGTKSFWEGVDIQGKELSAVVIDKLPFPAPSVNIKAEREYAQNVLNQLPFMSVDLPRAIIDLKQGAGRLIRCESDKGVVIICDPRLLNAKSKSYREQIMSALPSFAYTENEPVVLDFLGKINEGKDSK